MNYGAIPAWLFKPRSRSSIPAILIRYLRITPRALSSMARRKRSWRLLRPFGHWSAEGGLTDENGTGHESGSHYSFPYLGSAERGRLQHSTTPELYAQRYDAIVSAIHAVSPETKFVGLALAQPSNDPKSFEYFLDASHHKPRSRSTIFPYHFSRHPVSIRTSTTGSLLSSTRPTAFLRRPGISRRSENGSPQIPRPTQTNWVNPGNGSSGNDCLQGATRPNPECLLGGRRRSLSSLFLELTKLGIDVIGERS